MASTRTMQKKATITRISDTEARIERTFDAPRELVWRAHTEPELMAKWLGPRRLKMRIEQMDLRVGGKYRYVHIEEDGTEYAFRGEFLAIVKPERLSQTWIFEGFPDAGSVETMTLTEKDGKTHMVAVTKFEKKEHIDAHLASGMEGGMQESYERLDELLATLA